MHFLRGAVALSLLLAVAACSAEAPLGTSDDHVESADALAFDVILPELAAKGITGTVKKLADQRLREGTDHSGAPEAENQYYLEVRFGKLTREHFDVVAEFFGGRSKVPYDADRAYELVDFLDPAMQAVVNRLFDAEAFSGSSLAFSDDELRGDTSGRTYGLMKGGIEVNANCFNTSLELVRRQAPKYVDDAYLFYIPSRDEATKWFTSDDYSAGVTEKKLRAGDVLVVQRREPDFGNSLFLAHSAVLLSKELLIEKTNGSSNEPYRVSLRKDVLALYDRVLGKNGDISYRRFHGAGKKALPSLKLPVNALTERQQDVVKQAFPTLQPENIVLTEELRMGGGFDLNARAIVSASIAIDPKTGRGTLEGDPSALGRLSALAGK